MKRFELNEEQIRSLAYPIGKSIEDWLSGGNRSMIFVACHYDIDSDGISANGHGIFLPEHHADKIEKLLNEIKEEIGGWE